MQDHFLELRDPPPNTGPVLIFGGGIKLTHDGQTLTWDFLGPTGKEAGTRMQIVFAYATGTSGIEDTPINSVKIFGTIGALD